MMMTRRRFLKALAGAAALTGSSSLYGTQLEPEWLEVDPVDASLRKGADLPPIRIVQLSDIHVSNVVKRDYLEHTVQLALQQRPDIVVLTGDYVTVGFRVTDELAEILKPLADAVPCLAVTGNHDGHSHGDRFPKVRAQLEAAGARLLHNQVTTLKVRGRALTFAGVGDLWTGECKPDRCLTLQVHAPEKRDPTILLSHNPDSKNELQPYDWDLMLCGHTHGGQVRIPIIGTPFAPVQDKRYVEGLRPFSGRRIYTTRGVGNLHGIRFNCRPQVSVLEV